MAGGQQGDVELFRQPRPVYDFGPSETHNTSVTVGSVPARLSTTEDDKGNLFSFSIYSGSHMNRCFDDSIRWNQELVNEADLPAIYINLCKLIADYYGWVEEETIPWWDCPGGNPWKVARYWRIGDAIVTVSTSQTISSRDLTMTGAWVAAWQLETF